jgi:hypothetical protein
MGNMATPYVFRTRSSPADRQGPFHQATHRGAEQNYGLLREFHIDDVEGERVQKLFSDVLVTLSRMFGWRRVERVSHFIQSRPDDPDRIGDNETITQKWRHYHVT